MSIYNEKFIWVSQAINSILNQSYKNFELIIIVDNPDLDKNISEYIEKLSREDSRVILIKNLRNYGLAYSLNVGIQKAHGKYIARMDADDISMPERIEKQVEFLEMNPNISLVGTGRYYLTESGEINMEYSDIPVEPEKIKKILPIFSCIIHPTIMIRTDVLKTVGGYRNFRQSQDYDLWLRLLSAGYKMANLNSPLIQYRLRSSSISIKKPYLQYKTACYERKLYKMRLKNTCDDFTIDNLEKYLMKHKAYDLMKNKKYVLALNLLNSGIHDLKYKRIKGLLKFIQAFYFFPESMGMLYNKTRGVMINR